MEDAKKKTPPGCGEAPIEGGILYTYAGNPQTHKILITAKYCNVSLDVKQHAPDFILGETNQTDPFLARFPSSSVPALLTPEGLPLADSSAMAHYLVARRLRLGGTGARRRVALQLLREEAEDEMGAYQAALCQQYVHMAERELRPAVTTWIYGKKHSEQMKQMLSLSESRLVEYIGCGPELAWFVENISYLFLGVEKMKICIQKYLCCFVCLFLKLKPVQKAKSTIHYIIDCLNTHLSRPNRIYLVGNEIVSVPSIGDISVLCVLRPLFANGYASSKEEAAEIAPAVVQWIDTMFEQSEVCAILGDAMPWGPNAPDEREM
eukprot:Nk52_evm22s216 gene=Nk52_evmTU22s216